MKYAFDTWRNGTSQHMLSVATAAGLLADDETITVAAMAAEQGHGVNKGEPAPGMSLVLWANPLAGEPGEPRFVMRWASGSLVYPGADEIAAMHRVTARAGRIAALAETLRDGEDAAEAEPEGWDLTRALAAVAIAALRSPHGTSPAAAVALAGLKRNLGIDGATPVDEAIAAIRAALEASHGA